MKTENVIAGLQILVKYIEGPFGIGTMKDVIYTSVRHDEPSVADIRVLQHLGWYRHDNGYWATFV